jgi:hypothetical protein
MAGGDGSLLNEPSLCDDAMYFRFLVHSACKHKTNQKKETNTLLCMRKGRGLKAKDSEITGQPGIQMIFTLAPIDP